MPEPGKGRLLSLDAFRGLVMAFMVIVNNPGDGRHVYWPLEHAEWHGWTPTDVVFPSFVWIVGVALTLSFAKRTERGDGPGALFRQALRRSAILFAMGMAVYAYPHFEFGTQRILGVLQRIAICYLASAAIFLTTRIRGQILWIVGLMAAYWCLMGGRWDVEGNFAHYVDRVVLGSHNYGPTKTWDPEGLVSTLPAIATCLLGVMAGHVLRRRESIARRSLLLLWIGVSLAAAGLVLNHWMPINKKIWTDSFVLWMAGLDFVLFAGFLWTVDGLGWRRPVKPLVIMGVNAIVLYLASEFLDELLGWLRMRDWLYEHWFASAASPYNASLLYAPGLPDSALSVRLVLISKGLVSARLIFGASRHSGLRIE